MLQLKGLRTTAGQISGLPPQPDVILEGLPTMPEWEAWLYSAASGQLTGWQQWRDFASTALDRCKTYTLCRSTHDYLAWVQEQACSNYCRGLYRWTKGAEPILPRTEESLGP